MIRVSANWGDLSTLVAGSAMSLRRDRVVAGFVVRAPQQQDLQPLLPTSRYPAAARLVPLIPVTNAIEALNSKLRRAVRARGHFPSDEAATKPLFLVLNHSEKEWSEWAMA